MKSTYRRLRPALMASAAIDCQHVANGSPEPCKDCLWWASQRTAAFLSSVPPDLLRMPPKLMAASLKEAICDG